MRKKSGKIPFASPFNNFNDNNNKVISSQTQLRIFYNK